MKLTHFYLLFLALFVAVPSYSQEGSITQLDEVVLSDISLERDSRGRKVTVLNDSVLRENRSSLTSLLKFNSPVFFRENGPGMVASASFRGTSAQQTAVVWNGININSQFTGQTDFNTVNTGNFDDISLRHGGGSVLYGSGAIGGSIHLNNRFSFDQKSENLLRLNYGSFDTFSGTYRGKFSSEKTSLQLSLTGEKSENDFNYYNTFQKNENGDYYNTGLSAAIAHRINEKNILKFYTNYFLGQRAFSGTLTAPSQSKFEDKNSRNLLEWQSFSGDFTSTLKLAYLDEHFKYFENRKKDEFNYGRAKTGLAKYDLSYHVTSNLEFTGIAEFQQINGEGSNTGENTRNISAFSALMRHSPGKFQYQVSLRKEATNNYDSPLLFSINTGWQILPQYDLRLNISKNFRIPTLNDLYWYAGGNINLIPESSIQGEFGQTFKFKNLEFDLAAYVMEIENLLRWIPGADGLWRPVNTDKALNYGLESSLNWKEKIEQHQVEINFGYAWTNSLDWETRKQLIYVPEHKATASLGYSFNRISAFYQFLHTGSIFTSSDNNYSLSDYTISNLGIGYEFGRMDFLKIGFQVQNLFDEKFMSMPSRPMPGRHFNSSISFKF